MSKLVRPIRSSFVHFDEEQSSTVYWNLISRVSLVCSPGGGKKKDGMGTRLINGQKINRQKKNNCNNQLSKSYIFNIQPWKVTRLHKDHQILFFPYGYLLLLPKSEFFFGHIQLLIRSKHPNKKRFELTNNGKFKLTKCSNMLLKSD